MTEGQAMTSEGGWKLEVRNLAKSYGKDGREVEALRDVNFSIADGEFVSIVGASGCGKTTLLRLLDGLIAPTTGAIYLDGTVMQGPGFGRALVFQQDRLLPWRNVLSNVQFGPEIQHRNGKAERERAAHYVDLVGLRGFEKHYPHELSGGMRQRVNLARALNAEPEVLLLDEPFASLDAQTREIMQAELLRITTEARKTAIFVTHQIDEAVYLSDRVLVFTVRPGRLKEEVRIDLPRPRQLDVKRTPEFVRYTNHIWQLIEQEVRDGIGLEAREAAALHA
ncbi:MAG TPA: ABC transporter ATP-binding protein [Stellaceae bacterium]|jgi:NitT/TauT family transport system ATP-binding protein|nr:ABC transporter ATP-binding protein [Stellaceae bacterium]